MSRKVDEEAEMARLNRAINKELKLSPRRYGSVTDVHERKAAFQKAEFSDSTASVLAKVSENWVKDDDDEEIEEEEIVVEDVHTPPQKNTPVVPVPSLAVREEVVRPVVEERVVEKPAPVKELTDEEKLAKILEETTARREQEQAMVRAQLKREAEKAREEREFAQKALEVSMKTPSAPPKVATRKCPRCDKDTPVADALCKHCGVGMLSALFSF